MRHVRGIRPIGAAALVCALLLGTGSHLSAEEALLAAAAPAQATATQTDNPETGSLPASPTVLFADDFSFADAGWSLLDARIEDGALLHTPKPDQWSNAFYFGSLFHDADVRVKSRIVGSSDPASTAASLAFWHSDGKNFYSFTYWPESAFVRVTRFQGGNSIAVVEKTVEGPKVALQDWVEMRVVTKGNVAAIYLNGKELGRFKGEAPPRGWKLGTFASAPKGGSATVAFRDLEVLPVQ